MTSESIQEILRVLPHRFPFLLIDRVLEVKTGQPLREGMTEKEWDAAKPGTIVRAVKNVTFNEIQFMGHFPGAPVMPGVLTLEALAQAAVFATLPFSKGKAPSSVALLGVNKARFRKPVFPGDQMQIQVEIEIAKKTIWTFQGTVFVEGQKVADANFLALVEL